MVRFALDVCMVVTYVLIDDFNFDMMWQEGGGRFWQADYNSRVIKRL